MRTYAPHRPFPPTVGRALPALLLTGLVLPLEPPLSDLYLKAQVFFDLPEEDRVETLKALDRGEWRRLYLYRDVLLGVAEAAVGYQTL